MPVILSKFFKGRFHVRHIRIQNHISVMLTRLSVFIPNLYGLTIFITFLSIVSVIDTKTQTSKSAGKTNSWPTNRKTTIENGGSTALYTVYIHCLYLFYYSNCLTLLKHQQICLYILLGKVKTILEWVNGFVSEQNEG